MENFRSRACLAVLLLCACPSSEDPPSGSTGTGSTSGDAEGSVGNSSATMTSSTSGASTSVASESAGTTTATATATATGLGTDATGADETSGSDSTGQPEPAVPMCVATCQRPSDCGLPSLLYNEDNWACNAGECEWLGCLDDGECIQNFMNGNYECRDVGEDVDQCVATCSEAGHCARPSPLYDNNWTCSNAGECEWTGCTDDGECQAAFMNSGYICAEEPGFDVPQCIATCSEPSDCSRPNALYDGDNWACEDERCEWLGCNDDQECISGLMNGSQVCVSPE